MLTNQFTKHRIGGAYKLEDIDWHIDSLPAPYGRAWGWLAGYIDEVAHWALEI